MREAFDLRAGGRDPFDVFCAAVQDSSSLSMPRLWLAACLVLASSTALHAQPASSLDGTVADGETGELLVGANIAILDASGAV